jgi:wyosine [tRNA(Phe)-imidazoG37] synthetase (radical SAM superfamily)
MTNKEMERRLLQQKIVYGPINSRRLGKSMGLNILPTKNKVCSFDCLYCQYGFTPTQKERWHVGSEELPTPGDVAMATMETLPAHKDIDVLTLAGNGETTLHPEFRKICEVVVRQRDMYRPSLPICILSNSSTVGSADVRAGLKLLERPMMKLDAGTQATFELLNRPRPGVRLDKIVEGLAMLGRLEIQTLFVTGPVDNTTDEEVAAWLDHLEKIGPRALQLYTFERVPAESTLVAARPERIEEIAVLVRERLPEAEVQVF